MLLFPRRPANLAVESKASELSLKTVTPTFDRNAPSLLKQIDGMRLRRLSSTITGGQYVKFRKVLKFVPEVLIFRHAEAAPVRPAQRELEAELAVMKREAKLAALRVGIDVMKASKERAQLAVNCCS